MYKNPIGESRYKKLSKKASQMMFRKANLGSIESEHDNLQILRPIAVKGAHPLRNAAAVHPKDPGCNRGGLERPLTAHHVFLALWHPHSAAS